MQAKNTQAAPGQPAPRLPHNLILENRRTATITGVTRVLSCDDTGASLETQQGTLTIGGRGIQVSELSIQTGELKIFGQIDYLQYAENKESGGGFWHRLLR